MFGNINQNENKSIECGNMDGWVGGQGTKFRHKMINDPVESSLTLNSDGNCRTHTFSLSFSFHYKN